MLFGREVETLDHLLFGCCSFKQSWRKFVNKLGNWLDTNTPNLPSVLHKIEKIFPKHKFLLRSTLDHALCRKAYVKEALVLKEIIKNNLRG